MLGRRALFLPDKLPVQVQRKEKRNRGAQCFNWLSEASRRYFSSVCRWRSSVCISRALLTAETQGRRVHGDARAFGFCNQPRAPTVAKFNGASANPRRVILRSTLDLTLLSEAANDKPDVPISGIRLSGWLHREARDGAASALNKSLVCAGKPERRMPLCQALELFRSFLELIVSRASEIRGLTPYCIGGSKRFVVRI
jgi:hypothetical protein